jgi:hypothetical protein
MDRRIGKLFPLGGPVPPELVIGRTGDIDEIHRRLREGIHTMLVGPRRIGKTTVCDAVCARLRASGTTVIDIEVPERADAAPLLRLIAERCTRASIAGVGRRVLRAAGPLVQDLLEKQGVPVDLSELSGGSHALPSRAILSLPRALARETRATVVLYLDELQRVVAYSDGEQVLRDLVDLYGGATDVVLLVDGSDERALSGMLGEPIHFGKLCDRLSLDPRIPLDVWREPLDERFERAGMRLETKAREALLAFGDGRPYATMAAARYAALVARKLDGADPAAAVGAFEARMGLDEAARHLEDDGAYG